jgi:nitric-oxide synthase
LHWQTLQVNDRREASTAEAVFDACVEHMRLATNGGRLRPLITVFAPRHPRERGIQIWNPQLIRYAGHRQPDGRVVGDPLHAELTDAIRALGWSGGAGTPFDVLPLVIEMPGEQPKVFELPTDAVLEVELSHPAMPEIARQGWRWHALPAVSNMCLTIGGVDYTAAPFSGWYASFEVGARNLSDTARYNLLPKVAEIMGLDTRSDRTLWKDRALVELNVAVVSSFAAAGVSIVDHHAVTRQFMVHQRRESARGRCVPADWAWIVPPLSGATTPVFHRTFDNVMLTPNFLYQPAAWPAADR